MKEKLRKIGSRIKGRVVCLGGLLFGHFMTAAPAVYAKGGKDVSDVTDGIDTLKNLVLACVAGVGVIFLAWGLLDFGTSYSAHDTTQQSQAIKKVVGGLIMCCVPAILKALGIA